MPGPAVTLLVAAGFTAAAVGARAVSFSGAVAGCALTVVFLQAGGWPGLLLFALLVVVGTGASRTGRARKRALGAAQTAGGRRGAAHALANAGPAALALLLVPGHAGLAAACGALAAALGDTVSGEVGLLSPRRPRLLLLGAPVRPGADGGMTLLGTGAGVGASALVAGAGLLAGPAGPPLFWGALLGGLAGNLADSVLGVVVEPGLPASWGNEAVNALASSLGGLVSWGLYAWLS